MLAWPFLPMMMWSCTAMPSGPRRLDDGFRHVDIGARGRRISRWVVVHEDDRGGRQFERAPHDLAGIDGRMVDGSGLLQFVGDQRVLLVE
jgi:hypothetical protein